MASRISKVLLFVFMVLLATVPESLTVEGKNYLLITFSILASAFLLLVNWNRFPSLRNDWLSLLLIYFSIVSIINYERAQPLSLVYSFFFIGTYVFYSKLAIENWNLSDYRRYLRILFFLFFSGLLLGQALVYFDFFSPLKQLSFGAFHGGFHSILEPSGYRFYSLSSEPSYAAFIVIVIFYSYTKFDPRKRTLLAQDNFLMLILLLYMIVMFRSGYGVVLLGLLGFSYVGFSRQAITSYIIFLIIGLILVNALPNFGPFFRINNLVKGFDINNLHAIQAIDFNVYVRLAPVLSYIETHPLDELTLYFGHGAGSSRSFVTPEIFAAYRGDFVGGFFPAFFYDYGLLGVSLVVYFLRSIISSFFSIEFVIVLLMLFNANFNTQLFWFTVFCFTLNKYFSNKTSESLN